jgi:hypothetical protein
VDGWLSRIRTVIPEVLDLVAAERIRPESVTTTSASFEDTPKVLSDPSAVTPPRPSSSVRAEMRRIAESVGWLVYAPSRVRISAGFPI